MATTHSPYAPEYRRQMVERWMTVARLWDDPKLDEGFMAAIDTRRNISAMETGRAAGLTGSAGCNRRLTGHAVMSRESIGLHAVFLSYAIDKIRQFRRRGDGSHQALPTQAAHKAWHAACGGRQLPLSFGLATVPELGVASIVNDKGVSRGRIKLAVRREGGDKRVSRQLINISERARLMIAACRPREQMGQMLPIPDADLGQNAALAASALDPVAPVAILFGIGRIVWDAVEGASRCQTRARLTCIRWRLAFPVR